MSTKSISFLSITSWATSGISIISGAALKLHVQVCSIVLTVFSLNNFGSSVELYQ